MKRRPSIARNVLSLVFALMFGGGTVFAALPAAHHHPHDATGDAGQCAACVAKQNFSAASVTAPPPQVERIDGRSVPVLPTSDTPPFSSPRAIRCRGPPAA
jgi:hypothetical protein